MKDKNSNLPRRNYIKGQPFMPMWLDEMQLSDSELRVLMHLWRRGQTCYPTVEQIATYLKKNEATIARIIKSLEGKGLLERSKRKGKRIHNYNFYTLFFQPLPNAGKNNKKNDPNASFKHGVGGGTKELNIKELNLNMHKTLNVVQDQLVERAPDLKSMPNGMVNLEDETCSLPDIITALKWAYDHYNKFKYDSTRNIGILKDREIEKITKNWLNKLEQSDGKIDGDVMRKPQFALEKYLEAAANNQSERCNEHRGIKTRKRKVKMKDG